MFENFALTFVAIFVALDIIGTLPLYIGMTQNLPNEKSKQIINTSMFVAFIVAVVFLFLGEFIFQFIGITIYDFKIAGGIVLLLVSLADLLGKQEASHRVTGSTGIVPLAVPLITGPGVLTTLILQVRNAGILITISALIINYIIAWYTLHKSEVVSKIIGKDGAVVFSKISALLLAAIAVAMIRSGLFDTVKAFQLLK